MTQRRPGRGIPLSCPRVATVYRASWAVLSENLLILWDIDGTMLLDDAYAHGRAIVEALRSIYAVELPDHAVQLVEPWGKTDLRIARDVLHRVGLEDAEIDRGLGAWVEAAGAAFAEAASPAASWRVRPGLVEALERLAHLGMRLTVVTGNLRAIATVKIVRMGLANRLDVETGAYGDDDEDRSQLVPLARARAGSPRPPWPRARTVVVGDTPRDAAAALADRARSVLFSSSRYPATLLSQADVVVADVQGLVATLNSWQAGP